MNGNSFVSVIIPTYNRAAMLPRTIDNVFEQTYRNFELIIVDDGSTDHTLEVLRRYGERIRVVSQPNSGPAVARNRGAQVARGDIIAFQDSDDLWASTKLERQIAILDKHRNIQCCLCNVLMGLVGGKPFTSFDHSLIKLIHNEGIWLNVLDVLATRFILFNQAAAIRRKAFERAGGFPEDLKYLEDYELPLRLAVEGPWAIIREPLVTYGQESDGSFSQQAKRDPVLLKQCEIRIYEKLLAVTADRGNHASARRSLNRRLGIARRQLAATQLEESGRPIALTATKVLNVYDRYRQGILRRLPSFPQPLTCPI